MSQGGMLTSRVERLVAGGRVVLACFSLLAIYLDPSEPAKYEGLTYSLLVLFVLWALSVALWTWPRVTHPLVWKIATHVTDLLFFTVLIYFTEGPVSPFFLYFVFALFSATLRLGVRGVVWTAVSAISIFLAMGIYASQVLGDATFELNRFLVRSVYLVVIASLLVHLASYEREVRLELGRLAAWPRTVPKTLEDLMRESLEIAMKMLSVPRVLIGWKEDSGPRLFSGSMQGGVVTMREEVADFVDPMLRPAAKRSTILRRDKRPEVLVHRDDGRFEWRSDADFDTEFLDAFRLQCGVVTFFRQEHVEGAVIFADRGDVTLEDVAAGAVAARIIGARLEQLSETRRAAQQAVLTTRMQVGRDLHDSLLQSLTGAALQLELLRRTVERDPVAAQERLGELQMLLAGEQRELRKVVQELQRNAAPVEDDEFVERLEALAFRFRHQWDLQVTIEADPMLTLLTPVMKHEVYSLVSEAVANAAKHAGATKVQVALSLDMGNVALSVKDDGRGFPFQGRYALAELNEMRRGPVTLKERVASLGGSLVIESARDGAHVMISVPLGRAGETN